MTKKEALACYERLLASEESIRNYLQKIQGYIDDLEGLSGYYLNDWHEDKKKIKEIPYPALYEEEKLLDTFERWLDYFDELVDIVESVSIEG